VPPQKTYHFQTSFLPTSHEASSHHPDRQNPSNPHLRPHLQQHHEPTCRRGNTRYRTTAPHLSARHGQTRSTTAELWGTRPLQLQRLPRHPCTSDVVPR